MLLTNEEIKVRVEQIREVAHDDEHAHGLEDFLWRDVLEAISKNQVESPSTAAFLALRTREIEFARWRA